jgi:hypothetical protein
MKPIKRNKIARTKTVYNSEKGNYYDIELMTYGEFVSKSEYIYLNEKFYLYSYKWYDFRIIVDYTYYLLFKSFSNPDNKRLKLNSIKSIIIRVLLFLIDVIISGGITKMIF